MKSIVVSDSTALIIISKIDTFYLLENLFEKVFIANSVYEEINQKEQLSLPVNFFEKLEPKAANKSFAIPVSLDKGELDSIFLAKELNVPLLIDEKKGRKVAVANGIPILGLVGLIIRNHKKGFIDKNRAIEIFNSAKEASFRVSKSLEEEFYETL